MIRNLYDPAQDIKLDRNNYGPSIMGHMDRCWLCGSCARKLDRHEIFGGANRDKSKRYGLWCLLCHETCHEGPDGAHGSGVMARYLRAAGQRRAMEVYGWTEDQFRDRFGRSYL